MIFEIWRKLVATDYSVCNCGICGNDFDRGSVVPVAATDDGAELGEVCPVCLEYLNLRKGDAQDPTLENWPARDWPTTEVLEQLRRQYPDPMFDTREGLLAAATDYAAEQKIYEESVLWRMERESAPA